MKFFRKRVFVGSVIFFYAAIAFSEASQKLQNFREVHYVMGTTLDITLVSRKADKAKKLLKAAFDIANSLDRKLSTYKDQSEISRLNRSKELQLSAESYELIKESIFYSNLTSGVFDITFNSKQLFGYKKIFLEKDLRVKLGSNIELNFGAIGKGYAVDQIVKIFDQAKENDWFINFGNSSISTSGAPKDQDHWPVLLNLGEQKLELWVKKQHLSTSGTYLSRHILNPVTQKLVAKNNQVSVTASSAVLAEVLSTSLLVDPKLLGLIIETYPDLEYLISNKLERKMSVGFRQRLSG